MIARRRRKTVACAQNLRGVNLIIKGSYSKTDTIKDETKTAIPKKYYTAGVKTIFGKGCFLLYLRPLGNFMIADRYRKTWFVQIRL